MDLCMPVRTDTHTAVEMAICASIVTGGVMFCMIFDVGCIYNCPNIRVVGLIITLLKQNTLYKVFSSIAKK